MIKWEETFAGDQHVHGIDCGDGFMHSQFPPNSLSCKH